MADVAERRRMKLLAREAQLSGSNPRTSPAPVQLVQEPVAAPTPNVSASEATVKREEPPKIDYRLINSLQAQQKTFQISKKINRLGISLVLGIFFHYCFVITSSRVFTLESFILVMLSVYYMTNVYEHRTYTQPIEVSVLLRVEHA